MALKKNFSDSGTKYHYVKITEVNYVKNHFYVICVQTEERDSADPSHNKSVARQQFNCSIDEGFFAIESLSQAGNNFLKEGYSYLKTETHLFNEHEDC